MVRQPRQVAVQDTTEKGHLGLASYYSERGETPGQWVGSGLAGIEGLDAGDVVSDLNTKRAKIHGINPDGGMSVIDAEVPLIVAIIAIVFIALNRVQAQVNFLFFRVDTSLWLALSVAAILGLIVGWFINRK